MIEINDKKDCCGCNACGDICHVQAISFQTDHEGFWYPVVDKNKCDDCHLCEKICPIINIDKLKKNDFLEPLVYGGYSKDIVVRFDSTSGGLFSILAQAMYKQKGIGEAAATWTANLPAEGPYEIFIWNARNKYVQGAVTIDADGTQRVAPKRTQNYIVRYGEEEETIVVEVDSEPNDWVSLGQFYLPTGETSITLTDETNGSYVIADAVKFTRIE